MTTIQLLTAGPHYALVEGHAKTIGLDIAPYRFVRQQDIKRNGVEVFPRVWEGLDHKGNPVRQVFNGGEPGLHDHPLLVGGCSGVGPTHLWDAAANKARSDPRPAILDLEPQWQDWLKGTDPRRIVDAVDVIRTTVDASGAAALAFTFYPEMWNKVAECRDFFDWWDKLPLHTPDAYLWDAPNRDAWTRDEYRAMVNRWFGTLLWGIPARKIVPFRTVAHSGEMRPNTEAEERFITDEWAKHRVRRFFLWVGCDSYKEALASIALLTPERLRWMREGGAA